MTNDEVEFYYFDASGETTLESANREMQGILSRILTYDKRKDICISYLNFIFDVLKEYVRK